MWTYHSPVGEMTIRYNRQTDRFELFISGIPIGSYSSADKAADDVYCFETGFPDWDSLDGAVDDVPSDISEWGQTGEQD